MELEPYKIPDFLFIEFFVSYGLMHLYGALLILPIVVIIFPKVFKSEKQLIKEGLDDLVKHVEDCQYVIKEMAVSYIVVLGMSRIFPNNQPLQIVMMYYRSIYLQLIDQEKIRTIDAQAAQFVYETKEGVHFEDVQIRDLAHFSASLLISYMFPSNAKNHSLADVHNTNSGSWVEVKKGVNGEENLFKCKIWATTSITLDEIHEVIEENKHFCTNDFSVGHEKLKELKTNLEQASKGLVKSIREMRAKTLSLTLPDSTNQRGKSSSTIFGQ